jgi:hypothetical protein
MKLPLTGGCVCGEVRYECAAPPLAMLKCHCRDCQRTSGGPYAPVLVLPFADFKLTRGSLRHFATTRLNGRPNQRGFCPTCGSRLTLGEDPARNLLGLLAASLDEPGCFQPTAEIFTCDTQPWDHLDAALPRHEQYARGT